MNKYNVFLAVALVVAYVAISPSEQEKTKCQVKREDALKTVKDIEASGKGSNLAIVVPECTAEGDYATLQCHYGSNFCSCWDKDGYPLSQPKKNLKKCTCLVDRAMDLKSIPASQVGDAPMTNCESDGNYQAKQCNRSACWCVNPETGKKLGTENKDKNALKC